MKQTLASLEKEIEELKKKIIHSGMARLRSSNIANENKLKELIKKKITKEILANLEKQIDEIRKEFEREGMIICPFLLGEDDDFCPIPHLSCRGSTAWEQRIFYKNEKKLKRLIRERNDYI